MASNHSQSDAAPRQPPLIDSIAAAWPVERWQDVTVLVGVSGGADSVGLLHGLSQLKANRGDGLIVVAHFNHGLRGAESDEDEQFVRRLCDSLGLACAIGRAAVPLESSVDGLEATARRARYRFFEQTAAQRGARYIAVAHTLDDQAETILHRIARGTGLAGLRGMSPARRLGELSLVRPLLGVRRQEIRDYLAGLGQSFREDSSNVDLSRTRNRIRRQILPLLTEAVNDAVPEALVRLGQIAGEAQHCIAELARHEASRRITRIANGSDSGTTIALDCTGLDKLPRYLVVEMLIQLWDEQHWPRQGMTHFHWLQLADMALSRNSDTNITQVFPGVVDVRRRAEHNVLMLNRNDSSRPPSVTPLR